MTRGLLAKTFDPDSLHTRAFILAGPDIPAGPINGLEALYLQRLTDQLACLVAAIQTLEGEAGIAGSIEAAIAEAARKRDSLEGD